MGPSYTKCIRQPASTTQGTAGSTADYRPQGGELPVISPELTSELLHCLSTLPDPWPLAKITIDMEKPSQWVSRLCRLYFADENARRTVGAPSASQAPHIEAALQAIQKILPKLETRMIEFLAEWLVTFLITATHVLEVRAPLSFMFLKEYWFRELYLGLKVTASFDRSESYTRVIDGQVRCITPEISRRTYRSSGTFSLSLFFRTCKGRCTVTGPYREKTTAIHFPINADTGLHQGPIIPGLVLQF